jgi:hypothetical protein
MQLFSRFGSSADTTVEQLMQMGVFTLQFYKDCLWHVVTVDSFLPCRVTPAISEHVMRRQSVTPCPLQDASLVFASSGDPNVFWPSIVEKAYAKLHGSYSSLQGGSVADALVDLTGLEQPHSQSNTIHTPPRPPAFPAPISTPFSNFVRWRGVEVGLARGRGRRWRRY